MANLATREAIDGADTGVWASYESAQNRRSIGQNACRLYDDSGTLKITKGRIGFYNSSQYYTINVDTVTTISLAGVSNSNWFSVKLTISGSTPSFDAADYAGETDPASLPAAFIAAFDDEKGGFYEAASARTVAIGYKDSGGNLAGIINTGEFIEAYQGMIDISGEFWGYEKGKNINKRTVFADADYDLPTVSGNEGMEIFVMNEGTHGIEIDGNGAETIEGDTSVWLWAAYDYLHLLAVSTGWIILGGRVRIEDGYFNTSDWTNRHLGSCEFDIDNGDSPSLGFQVGELITETGGNAVVGKLIDLTDNGDGTGTMVIIEVTNGGVLTDGNTVTGDISGKTADVDEIAGNNKNQDSYVVHNLNKNVKELRKELLASSDGTENNSQSYANADFTLEGASKYAFQVMQIDTNNYNNQTATNGLFLMQAAGTTIALDTEDYYYNNITEWSR